MQYRCPGGLQPFNNAAAPDPLINTELEHIASGQRSGKLNAAPGHAGCWGEQEKGNAPESVAWAKLCLAHFYSDGKKTVLSMIKQPKEYYTYEIMFLLPYCIQYTHHTDNGIALHVKRWGVVCWTLWDAEDGTAGVNVRVWVILKQLHVDGFSTAAAVPQPCPSVRGTQGRAALAASCTLNGQMLHTGFQISLPNEQSSYLCEVTGNYVFLSIPDGAQGEGGWGPGQAELVWGNQPMTEVGAGWALWSLPTWAALRLEEVTQHLLTSFGLAV